MWYVFPQAVVEEKWQFEVTLDEKKGRIVLERHGGHLELRMSERTEQKTREEETDAGGEVRLSSGSGWAGRSESPITLIRYARGIVAGEEGPPSRSHLSGLVESSLAEPAAMSVLVE